MGRYALYNHTPPYPPIPGRLVRRKCRISSDQFYVFFVSTYGFSKLIISFRSVQAIGAGPGLLHFRANNLCHYSRAGTAKMSTPNQLFSKVPTRR
ncbi:triosephosphate isomerase [Anopheles sinensis]|uniref:Triosephosphate isomerase n=1 Tax=Anopheles sinensis TaxID=74873 RepID=A0A084WUX6_ANOSI|nr:triosephosphate isomerase [Anopheles sinensis]